MNWVVGLLLVWGCVGVVLAAAFAGTIRDRETQIPRGAGDEFVDEQHEPAD